MPATPQRCVHSDSFPGPTAVSRLAGVGHLQQCPRGSVPVRKHLHMFLFWLWLVVGTQADWQLVKPGEATASLTPACVPFPTFQSRCFSFQQGKCGLSGHTGRCGMPVIAYIPRDPAAASCDVPNPNLNLRSPKGAEHEDSMCFMQNIQVPCSPKAGDLCLVPAQTLHRFGPR